MFNMVNFFCACLTAISHTDMTVIGLLIRLINKIFSWNDIIENTRLLFVQQSERLFVENVMFNVCIKVYKKIGSNTTQSLLCACQCGFPRTRTRPRAKSLLENNTRATCFEDNKLIYTRYLL